MASPLKIALSLAARAVSPLSSSILTPIRSNTSLRVPTPVKSHFLGVNDKRNILGEGTFGLVMKVKYKNEIVAAKFAKRGNRTNEINSINFNHKNVVKTLDFIDGYSKNIVVMEYCDSSRNLQSVIDDKSFSIDSSVVKRIATDVICGLGYCHQNKVLHLDIKPKNVLCCGVKIVCKICDFGNSVKLDSGQNWVFKGTVAYTAPEILKGAPPTTKSDIYSFGILLWQLLTRRSPFPSTDNHVLIYQIVKFDLRPTGDIPKELGHFLKLCQLCWGVCTFRPEPVEIKTHLNSLL